jgi:site-specific DNA-methyltransferase (adenine-specific)
MAELKLFMGRAEDGYRSVPDESVDVGIFSPPYYRGDGWTPELMAALGTTMARVLKPGGRSWMVFGPVKEGLQRPHKSAELLCMGGGGALTWWQSILWVKSIAVGGWTEEGHCECGRKVKLEVPVLTHGHYTPLEKSRTLVHYGHEFVFQFVKGKPDDALPLDRLAVGVPFADKGNMDRGTRGKNGDLHCSGDTWYVPYETTGAGKKKLHRHSFPAEIARRCLLLSRVSPGMTVFDPFSGGGTTALVAKALGLNAFAGDVDPAALQSTAAAWRALSEPEAKIMERRQDVFVIGG